MNCLVSDKDLTNHAIVMKVYYRITKVAIYLTIDRIIIGSNTIRKV